MATLSNVMAGAGRSRSVVDASATGLPFRLFLLFPLIVQKSVVSHVGCAVRYLRFAPNKNMFDVDLFIESIKGNSGIWEKGSDINTREQCWQNVGRTIYCDNWEDMSSETKRNKGN